MYEFGVVAALIIWFWRLIYVLLELNSKKAENLKIIGRRLSWVDLSVKEITLKYLQEGVFYKVLKFVLIWIIIPFLFVFTSWVYVIYNVGIFLYKKSQDSGMPNDFKEYQWKINNLKLTFDQMAELTYKLADQSQVTIEEFKEYLNGSHESFDK